jgi:hypothetical protein
VSAAQRVVLADQRCMLEPPLHEELHHSVFEEACLKRGLNEAPT